MPTLSMFYGIIVMMFWERDSKHKLPHLHAVYSGEEVVVDLDGNVLEGKIPSNKMKLLIAWMEIHREELYANWELAQRKEQIYKIEPLR